MQTIAKYICKSWVSLWCKRTTTFNSAQTDKIVYRRSSVFHFLRILQVGLSLLFF